LNGRAADERSPSAGLLWWDRASRAGAGGSLTPCSRLNGEWTVAPQTYVFHKATVIYFHRRVGRVPLPASSGLEGLRKGLFGCEADSLLWGGFSADSRVRWRGAHAHRPTV